MYYRVKSWKKVSADRYDSDQMTFDFKKCEYVSVYTIDKVDGLRKNEKLWITYRTEDKDENDKSKGTRRIPMTWGVKTLKEAKKIAEDHFGIQYQVDDIDRA